MSSPPHHDPGISFPAAFSSFAPSQPSSNDSAAESNNFLHLVPQTPSSQVLFNTLAWHAQHAHVAAHHRQFLPDLSASTGHNYDPETLVDPSRPPYLTQEQAGGFWRLGIQDRTLWDLVWVFGKGQKEGQGGLGHHGGVDVKLGIDFEGQEDDPAGTFYCAGGDAIAVRHFRIFMHSRSGAFMLEALEDLELDDRALRRGRIVALMKTRTLVKIGLCGFWLVFNVRDQASEIEFLRKRDERLVALGREAPKTRISGVPMPQDVMIDGKVVFRHGLGHGTFGVVSEGFGPSGSLRAVKRLAVRKEDERALAKRERVALEMGQACENIVKLYCTVNGRGGKDEGVAGDGALPFDLLFVFEKGTPFHQVDFDAYGMETKIRLAQGVLRALKFIHGSNMLHRDITPQNLIIAGSPSEAKLIDFGKVSFEPQSDNPYLAAECYLPPEVSLSGRRKYGFELDIHMAGNASARSFAVKTFKGGVVALSPRKLQQWRVIRLNMLYSPSDHVGSRGLMRVLVDMMDWEPCLRPTAEALLDYPVFNPAKQVSGSSKLLQGRAVGQSARSKTTAVTTVLPPAKRTTK